MNGVQQCVTVGRATHLGMSRWMARWSYISFGLCRIHVWSHGEEEVGSPVRLSAMVAVHDVQAYRKHAPPKAGKPAFYLVS